MKASKIRIVVILLLIIFFGLLILFGSRNIYEGATAEVQKGPVGGTAPKGSKATIYNTNKKSITFATTDLITVKQIKDINKIDSNSYFMKVYYYIPKPHEYGGNKYYPISYIHHNLPSCFKVSFTNTDAEGFGPSTDYSNIFIQGPPEWDKKISKFYTEGINSDSSNSSYTFNTLVDDINNKKANIASTKVLNIVTKTINKKELVITVPAEKKSNHKKGVKSVPEDSPSKLTSNSFIYNTIDNTMEGVKFDGTYDNNFKTNNVLTLNRDNVVSGKSINLVTIYLNLNLLPKKTWPVSCN
jgi:hypothetical protein